MTPLIVTLVYMPCHNWMYRILPMGKQVTVFLPGEKGHATMNSMVPKTQLDRAL